MCSAARCGKLYLVTMNSVMFLAGLALVVLSIYLGVAYKGYGEVINATFIWAPLGVGLGLVLMSLLGCCGAIFESRVSLILYSVICSLLLLCTCVLGVFLLVEIGFINTAANTEDSATLEESGGVEDVTTFQAVTFNRCCDRFEAAYTVGECPCTKETSVGCLCYKNTELYNLLDKDFDEEFCEVLGTLEYVVDDETKVLVEGPPYENGGCGSGDPKVFQQMQAEYANLKLNPGAWAIFGTGLVMLAGVVLACVIVAKRSKAKDDGYQNAEDARVDKPVDSTDHEGIEMGRHDDEVHVDRPNPESAKLRQQGQEVNFT